MRVAVGRQVWFSQVGFVSADKNAARNPALLIAHNVGNHIERHENTDYHLHIDF